MRRGRAEIIPAVLPATFLEMERGVRLAATFTDSVQIDIVDGVFVESKGWPYTEGAVSDLLEVADRSVIEIDLMVERPEEVIDEWIAAGAKRIVVHTESVSSIEKCFRDGVEVGFALSISTPITILLPYLDRIPFIQCMGIEHIGHQGQPFNQRVVENLETIRKQYDGILQVDGGVHEESLPLLRNAGATRLVVGSAIFGSSDPYGAFRELSTLLHGDN